METKEHIDKLQLVDCNCNNCLFMVRDMDKFKKSLEFHEKMQKDSFDNEVRKLREKAENQRIIFNDLEKFDQIHRQASKMKFQFDKSTAVINYGNCSKFNKPVSFIPNTCQLETQKCFIHRKTNT